MFRERQINSISLYSIHRSGLQRSEKLSQKPRGCESVNDRAPSSRRRRENAFERRDTRPADSRLPIDPWTGRSRRYSIDGVPSPSPSTPSVHSTSNSTLCSAARRRRSRARLSSKVGRAARASRSGRRQRHRLAGVGPVGDGPEVLRGLAAIHPSLGFEQRLFCHGGRRSRTVLVVSAIDGLPSTTGRQEDRTRPRRRRRGRRLRGGVRRRRSRSRPRRGRSPSRAPG